MKILLATDGSIEADLAEEMLRKLPFSGSVTTTAMVVNPSLHPTHGPGTTRLSEDVALRTVVKVSERLQESGFASAPLVLSGDTAGQLLDLIEREEFDLIAIGSGRDGPSNGIALSSVAHMLALYAPCSVLLARASAHSAGEDSVSSLRSKQELQVLVVRHGLDNADLPEDFPEGAILSDCGPGEDLVKKIFAEATKRKTDLIVMGPRLQGDSGRQELGKWAYETLVSAPCSVLVLRRKLATKASQEAVPEGELAHN